MKIYFHFGKEGFTNSYLVVNDDPGVMQALLVDPCKITPQLISQVEDGGYTLSAALITHSHENHVRGLETLKKIYTPEVFAADYEVCGSWATLLSGDGTRTIAGLEVQYLSLPGHSSDSLVYRIENALFTGDVLFAGTIGTTNSKYAERMLRNNINAKLLTQNENCVVLPGHGPPTTIGAEKLFNIDLMPAR